MEFGNMTAEQLVALSQQIAEAQKKIAEKTKAEKLAEEISVWEDQRGKFISSFTSQLKQKTPREIREPLTKILGEHFESVNAKPSLEPPRKAKGKSSAPRKTKTARGNAETPCGCRLWGAGQTKNHMGPCGRAGVRKVSVNGRDTYICGTCDTKMGKTNQYPILGYFTEKPPEKWGDFTEGLGVPKTETKGDGSFKNVRRQDCPISRQEWGEFGVGDFVAEQPAIAEESHGEEITEDLEADAEESETEDLSGN